MLNKNQYYQYLSFSVFLTYMKRIAFFNSHFDSTVMRVIDEKASDSMPKKWWKTVFCLHARFTTFWAPDWMSREKARS